MRHTPYIVKRLDWQIVLVIVSLFAILWLQAPRLADEFGVDQDFRTFYLMNKFQDPALFPNDQLRGYRYVNIHLPGGGDLSLYFYSLGYWLLFYAASFLMTPIFFSKILAFMVLPIIVCYLFGFGQLARDRSTGVALAAGFMFLSLASPSSISIVTGLQRSFACSLIIALIYYLHRQKYTGAALVVLLSTLIYAPMFVLAVATWGLFALRITWPPRPGLSFVQRGLGPLLIATLLSVLILSPVLFTRFSHVLIDEKPVGVREQVASATLEPLEMTPESYEHIWDNPIYRAGGPAPLFFLFPFIGRGGFVNNGEDAVHLLILFCISCLIFGIRGRRAFDLPYEIWCVLWASLIAFALAWVTAWLTNSFLLYMPSRYTRVGLFLFLLVFVVWNSKDAAQEAVASIQRNRWRLAWLIGGVTLLVWGLVLLYPSDRAMISGFNMKWLLAPTGLIFGVLAIVVIRKPSPMVLDRSRLSQTPAGRALIGTTVVACLVGWAAYAPVVSKVDFLDPPPAERELLRFLETLPKDVLLAGTPCALDNVPLFAKRQVLFNRDLVSQDANLIREALNAYYTDDTQVVIDFCQVYGVDYLVVDLQVYYEEYLATEKIFFEPYHHELLPQLVDRDTFVLARVPDDSKVFQSGNLFVVPCDSSLAKVN
jgi:hypothetical protein